MCFRLLIDAICFLLGHLATITTLGTIPTELASLPAITTMTLYENALTGTLPLLGNMTTLTALVVFDNQITGTLPSDILWLTNLRAIRLDNNTFTSGVNATDNFLETFRQMTSLDELMLSHNPGLQGTIPSTLGDLTALTVLELHDTGFTGAIPAEMCDFEWRVLSVDCESVQCPCDACLCYNQSSNQSSLQL